MIGNKYFYSLSHAIALGCDAGHYQPGQLKVNGKTRLWTMLGDGGPSYSDAVEVCLESEATEVKSPVSVPKMSASDILSGRDLLAPLNHITKSRDYWKCRAELLEAALLGEHARQAMAIGGSAEAVIAYAAQRINDALENLEAENA